MDDYDDIIIGSGQAGPALAVALAGRGRRVAVIEGGRLGGTCVNTGCTPTKTLRKSARVAHLVRRAAEFGVETGPVRVDFEAAVKRMHARVTASRDGLTAWLSDTDGVELVRGWGAFDGRDGDGFVVVAGQARMRAERVFLNTGTRPSLPPVDGIGRVPHLDNESLLELRQCPQHLLIVGGSYIGLEMGQIFRRLGARVTIVHRENRLAEREDEDVSQAIAEFMREEGIELLLGAELAQVSQTEAGLSVLTDDGRTVEASHLLFATGRSPNTERLNLDSVGIETDDRGFIRTDEHLSTTVPGVWALGDVNRRGAFTHTSYHDHEIVLAAIEGRNQHYQWRDAEQRPTTYAMFTDPPLGRVGITLAQAGELARKGRRIATASMPMADVSRAKEEGETSGLMRLIVDTDAKVILGATILGFGGDEVVAVLSNFMASGASVEAMQAALPIHPTVAELLPSLLGSLKPLD
ncbi:MAG: mercuric reductase [Burkholderiaceae bacterium]